MCILATTSWGIVSNPESRLLSVHGNIFSLMPRQVNREYILVLTPELLQGEGETIRCFGEL
jgi:hypothetical protein